MSRKKTTAEFISESNILHNHTYDYSEAVYTTSRNKLTIICPIHGKFLQTAGNHLQRSGCPTCSGREKSTASVFIEKATKLHTNKYTYANVTYAGVDTPVSITCPAHGDFVQSPKSHLNGHGCPNCKKDNLRTKYSHQDKFIVKARAIHGDKYAYNKVIYKNNKTKVTITCPIHGDFEQSPCNHTNIGTGCPTCSNGKKQNTWTYTSWEEAGQISKSFEGYSFYVLECWNDKEKFYKVGKTYTNISKRYRTAFHMPYQWKLLSQIFGDARYISELETTTRQELAPHAYSPLISFGGQHECFSKSSQI